MNAPLPFFYLLSLISLAGCQPLTDSKPFMSFDLSPPALTDIRTLDSGKIEICFSEAAQLHPEKLLIQPELEIITVKSEVNKVVLHVAEQIPGKLYVLNGVAEDANRNRVQIVVNFYGFNPSIPLMRINEFTTRGSSSHPDKVELIIADGGNMGGTVLYQGTPGSYKDRLVFPAFQVKQGDFIVVHFKPQGLAQEIDETTAKDQSGGLDASDTAFDFWVKEGTGIGGNNGVLSLYQRPGGPIIDGVLYSNRSSWSDERYRGFGTAATMVRADELALGLGWIVEKELIRPEDGINPEGSTSTRSICRRKGTDTDTRHDWYIVPTRQASFGDNNSEEVYSP